MWGEMEIDVKDNVEESKVGAFGRTIGLRYRGSNPGTSEERKVAKKKIASYVYIELSLQASGTWSTITMLLSPIPPAVHC